MIVDYVNQQPKVLGYHDLMVHDYGPGQRFASVHAEMSAEADPLDCHDIIDDVERDALRELRVHLVIHYDPVVMNDAETNRLRGKVAQIVKTYDASLSIHDFRMVQGPGHTNLIFDIALPFSLKEKKPDIRNAIDAGLSKEPTKFYTVITFDETPTSAL